MNKTSRVEFTVELVRILTAIAIAYAVALVTLFAVSDDPIYIIQQFVLGPFSSVRRVGSIINLAIPFTFTGLCFCFMYAVNKFNLAGEGIFMFAGCVISWVAIKLGESVPAPVMIGLLLVIGALTGVVVSALPAWLDSKFNANIVVSSLMLNSILMFLSIYIMMYTIEIPPSVPGLLPPDNTSPDSSSDQAGLAIPRSRDLVAVLFLRWYSDTR
ncbi:MAG: ABC transporter permease subunit [Enterocloster sp.]